jgi:cytoskeletal protein RodZ
MEVFGFDIQEYQKKAQDEGKKTSLYYDLKEKRRKARGKSSRYSPLISLVFLVLLIVTLWFIFFNAEVDNKEIESGQMKNEPGIQSKLVFLGE